MIDPRDVEAAIADAIGKAAPLLRAPGLNAVAILRAICQQETSGGARAMATLHEPAYHVGGRYYDKALTWTWGCLAHQSYGPWQIMFPTACDFGYRGDPVALRDPAISSAYVVKILNAKVGDKYPDAVLEDYANAWNHGTARDGRADPAYAQAIDRNYHAAMGDLET